ncbi:putative bifunctional diguanylate cyclase/phosphodiesterase [Microbaculum marinum]|uniref:EAL domain-containing protein n=1 Tax=Microbaculum marinum TaxID=1764581 RepID=A0AAW9RHP0_9HYPH
MPFRIPNDDNSRNRLFRDLAVIGVFAVFVTALGIWLDAFDRFYEYSRAHEDYELDELLTFGFVATAALVVFSWRRVADLRSEISARKAAESRARHLANADALTGLPNRRRLEVELADALLRATPDAKRGFMLIDLNRFKPINDVYGHQAGDDLLVDFARRMSAAVDSDSIVFRLGGDEFAILTRPVAQVEQIARMARRILGALDIPFAAAGASINLGIGIGIAVTPDDATTMTELLRRADVALYRAKSERASTFHFFEAGMDRKVMRRARIEAELRKAVDEGAIHSHFQPIVRLGDRSIIGFEALARWTHPELGDIPPEEFISVAEDCGFIPKLSGYLLENACAVAVNWPKDIFLSFNISPAEISDPSLVLRILKALGRSGLTADRLEIELTENALVRDFEIARRTLSGLRNAGIRIALDDFGAGNSSLHHLRELHFDRLKIDRSFTSQMLVSEEAAAMVRAIIHLASALSLSTTAEGIEMQDQIGPLIADGCLEAQGHHFGGALPAERVAELLASDRSRAKA